jgi:hypothetical protein
VARARQVRIPAKEIGYSELKPIIFRLSEAKLFHDEPLIDISQERQRGGGEWL